MPADRLPHHLVHSALHSFISVPQGVPARGAGTVFPHGSRRAPRRPRRSSRRRPRPKPDSRWPLACPWVSHSSIECSSAPVQAPQIHPSTVVYQSQATLSRPHAACQPRVRSGLEPCAGFQCGHRASICPTRKARIMATSRVDIHTSCHRSLELFPRAPISRKVSIGIHMVRSAPATRVIALRD